MVSVHGLHTDRVEPASRATSPSVNGAGPSGTAAAGSQPGPATPLASGDLLAVAEELRGLLDELTVVAGAAAAWGLRSLRESVELALATPDALSNADNQVDFVEELVEAVWGSSHWALRGPSAPAATWAETLAGERRRQAVAERLDELASTFCLAVEAWIQRGMRPHWSQPATGFPSSYGTNEPGFSEEPPR